MDVLAILVVAVLAVLLALKIADRFNFDKKWKFFYNYFVTNRGYKRLLEGMKNIAIVDTMVTIRSRMKESDLPAMEQLAIELLA